jgi:hypothetical protein
MRGGGILWGRRPPAAGGGPVLRRRPALRAGRRHEGAPIPSSRYESLDLKMVLHEVCPTDLVRG